MRLRHALSASATCAALLFAPLAGGQTPQPAAAKPAPVYTPTSLAAEPGLPRTPDGHPDLQDAVWATSYLPVLEATPMTSSLVVSEADAKTFANMMVQGLFASGDPSIKIDPEIQVIVGESDGFPIVRGERRARMLVLPTDGKLPLTPEARKRLDRAGPGAGGGPDEDKMDNIEDRDSGERCLEVGGQPPMAMTVSYNRLQIVQADDYVVIHNEAGDETRIIPFASKHQPGPPTWLGDSIARWDGDTLVIETTRLRVDGPVRAIPAFFVGPDAKVTERFTRLSKGELLYQFTVEDPKYYTAPWLAEYSFAAVKTGMFPSPCHEGNYSLPNVLKGARMKEQRAGKKAAR